MRSTMDVGVLVLIEILEPIDHALRLLRSRCVVQPDQRAAVDFLAQDGKVASDGLDIEGIGRQVQHPRDINLKAGLDTGWTGCACRIFR